MFLQKVFPVLLIALNVGAAVMCMPSKSWGDVIYYAAAAVLNIAVAFLMK